MFEHLTSYLLIAAALFAIQIVRRLRIKFKQAAWANSMEAMKMALDPFNTDNKDKQTLRQVVDTYVQANREGLFEKWRMRVRSPTTDHQAEFKRAMAEAVIQIKDVIHRTTDLEYDKDSPLPFLAHRVEGYLESIARFHFVDQGLHSSEEFHALFLEICSNNSDIRTPTTIYRTLMGASYLRFQKVDPWDINRKVGPPFVMRYQFVDKRFGMLSVIEARVLHEIFPYAPICIITNGQPTGAAARLAKFFRMNFIDIRAWSIPIW